MVAEVFGDLPCRYYCSGMRAFEAKRTSGGCRPVPKLGDKQNKKELHMALRESAFSTSLHDVTQICFFDIYRVTGNVYITVIIFSWN